MQKWPRTKILKVCEIIIFKRENRPIQMKKTKQNKKTNQNKNKKQKQKQNEQTNKQTGPVTLLFTGTLPALYKKDDVCPCFCFSLSDKL